jgi:hypothetical protein
MTSFPNLLSHVDASSNAAGATAMRHGSLIGLLGPPTLRPPIDAVCLMGA